MTLIPEKLGSSLKYQSFFFFYCACNVFVHNFSKQQRRLVIPTTHERVIRYSDVYQEVFRHVSCDVFLLKSSLWRTIIRDGGFLQHKKYCAMSRGKQWWTDEVGWEWIGMTGRAPFSHRIGARSMRYIARSKTQKIRTKTTSQKSAVTLSKMSLTL